MNKVQVFIRCRVVLFITLQHGEGIGGKWTLRRLICAGNIGGAPAHDNMYRSLEVAKDANFAPLCQD